MDNASRRTAFVRTTIAGLLSAILVSGYASAAASTSPQTLSISGTPMTSVQPGQFYNFTPSVTTPTGRRVRFSVKNQPGWMFFSNRAGGLFGAVPRFQNIGSYPDIVITATDGENSVSLPPFTINVTGAGATLQPTATSTPTPDSAPTPPTDTAPAITDMPPDDMSDDSEYPPAGTGSVTLSWSPPSLNTNGSALMNLAGYRISYGTSAGALTRTIEVPTIGLTTYTIDDLARGTWYFALKAYDSSGIESPITSIVSKTIQ